MLDCLSVSGCSMIEVETLGGRTASARHRSRTPAFTGARGGGYGDENVVGAADKLASIDLSDCAMVREVDRALTPDAGAVWVGADQGGARMIGEVVGHVLGRLRHAVEDGTADQLRDLRDYGVSEGLESKLVQSSSKPIIHSAKRLSDLFPRRLPTCIAKMIGIPGDKRWNCEGGAVMFPASLTVGVGNKPPTVSLVGRAKVASWYAVPFRIIPDRGQRCENVSKPSTKQLCDVFQDDVEWSNLANQSHDVIEQAAPRAIEARRKTGDAKVLAREAPADDIDGNSIGSKSVTGQRPYIIITGNVGPVLRQHTPRKVFDLAEGDRLKAARAFKPEAEPADSAEKIEDAQLFHLLAPHRSQPSGDEIGMITQDAATGFADRDFGRASARHIGQAVRLLLGDATMAAFSIKRLTKRLQFGEGGGHAARSISAILLTARP